MTPVLLWLAAIIIIVYGALCALLYFQQERLIFFPTPLPARYQPTFALPFTEINLPVQGATINAVYFRAAQPKGVVLYLHGNGDIIPRLGSVADFFIGAGYDLLIPDYRGYGKSTGRIINEADLLADMDVVYRDLLARTPEGQIVIYGQSLGSGLATYLAAHHHPRAVILESPYVSVQAMAQWQLPWVPGWLVKYPLRSDRYVAAITCPLYIIHGTRDRVIPYAQGQKLYALIPGPKEFFTVPAGGHGSLLGDARVRNFVTKVLEH